MPAPISVVIPTLDAETQLPGCLEALIEALPRGLVREVIVSDGGSGDRTADIADAAGAMLLTGAPGRGAQIARGVAEAQAPWLMILHADSWLAPGWTEAAERHLAEAGGRAGWFRLEFRSPDRAAARVARWANWRARVLGLPYGDQGLLLPRTLLDEAGGVPDFPLMEDVALSRALRGRLIPIPALIRTSADRYHRDGWMRRGARNLWTLARYLAGADPARLAASYASPPSRN